MHGMFRRAVDGSVLIGLRAGDRADVDDMAPLPFSIIIRETARVT